MKALVHHGPGQRTWEEAPDPKLLHDADPTPIITHHFGLDDFREAYDVSSRPAETGALKVVLQRG
jgi:hypothetical protein